MSDQQRGHDRTVNRNQAVAHAEPQPLLYGLNDLRFIAVALALLSLFVAGASSGASRPEAAAKEATRVEASERTVDVDAMRDARGLRGRKARAALQRHLERLVAGLPATEGNAGGQPADGKAAAAARSIVPAHLQADVARFYRQRGSQPAWHTSKGRYSAAAVDLVEGLLAAEDHGLGGERYAARLLPDGFDAERPTAAERAAIDLGLTAAFFAHAERLARGQVDPGGLPGIWNLERREVDLPAVLEEAIAGNRIADAMAELAPPHAPYKGLMEAYRTYSRLAAEGGWPKIPDGPVVEPGEEMSRERFRALVKRLHAEGYLPRAAAEARLARLERGAAAPPAAEGPAAAGEGEKAAARSNPTLDPGLETALRDFQARHGLAVDGILGPNALAELNVSAEERARQIALNLERWRWLPADLGAEHVRVNIAAYELEGVRDGKVELRMPVVVGQRGWETPVMSDTMERVVVNPYWNVPRSIVEAEIKPKLASDPGYLQRQGFEVLENGERKPLAAVDRQDLSDPDVRVRQTPGAGNALGRIKFLFPNPYSVYLHDTPHRSGFAQHERALSHGCVRVERPVDLAAFVFAGEEDEMQEVERKLGSNDPETLELDDELPVHLLYFTAFVGEDGRVQFRRDVYGHDAALEEALVEAGWAS